MSAATALERVDPLVRPRRRDVLAPEPIGHGRTGHRMLVLAGTALALSGVLGNLVVSHPPPNGLPVPGLTVGVTHTQQSADDWGNAAAVARARSLLRSVAPVQNQHLMGWGALNPEPSPGEFDFTSLDRRIDMITSMGAEPVLTLCCAPDWMKGGQAGSTDWDRITKAPTREHFDDFARLAAAAAARYPQVHRFFVWNEFKGFYDAQRNDWDAAGYTDLYNRVYRAVKKVRPDALIGGPYVVFDIWASKKEASDPSRVSGDWGVLDQRALDAVDYWLSHAAGADFIAIDAGTGTRDAGLVTSDFEATAALGAITRWIRSRTDLPVWWAEVYASVGTGTDGSGSGTASSSDPRRAAVMAQALVTLAQAGASGVLLWQPEAGPSGHTAALFTATSDRGGGRVLPLGNLLRVLVQELRKDPRRVSTSWQPSGPRWVLRTPDWVVVWTPQHGLQKQYPTEAL